MGFCLPFFFSCDSTTLWVLLGERSDERVCRDFPWYFPILFIAERFFEPLRILKITWFFCLCRWALLSSENGQQLRTEITKAEMWWNEWKTDRPGHTRQNTNCKSKTGQITKSIHPHLRSWTRESMDLWGHDEFSQHQLGGNTPKAESCYQVYTYHWFYTENQWIIWSILQHANIEDQSSNQRNMAFQQIVKSQGSQQKTHVYFFDSFFPESCRCFHPWIQLNGGSLDSGGLESEGDGIEARLDAGETWRVGICRICRMQWANQTWVMVSNIFYFHPYLGKIPILTNIFQMGWNHKPETLAIGLNLVVFWSCKFSVVISFFPPESYTDHFTPFFRPWKEKAALRSITTGRPTKSWGRILLPPGK